MKFYVSNRRKVFSVLTEGKVSLQLIYEVTMVVYETLDVVFTLQVRVKLFKNKQKLP